MADTGTNGNGHGRLEKIAESKIAAAWQRIIVVVGTPLLVAAVSWGAWTLTGLDAEFTSIRGAINTQAAELKGAIDKVSQKVDGHDGRIDRLERWRDQPRGSR